MATEIQTTFEAISLLLVFVTILFDVRYKPIQDDLRKDIPQGPKAKMILKKDLLQSLLINCGILVVVNGAIAFLLAPLYFKVIRESRLDLFGFDFMRTAYFIVVSLISFYLLGLAF